MLISTAAYGGSAQQRLPSPKHRPQIVVLVLSYNTLLLRLFAISPARQTMQNVLEVQRVLREEIRNGEDDVYNCNEACVLIGERVRGAWIHVGGGFVEYPI